MPRKPGPTPSLLLRVMAALGDGGITEAWISDPGYMTDGVCDSRRGHITINPMHQTVDSVLHELTHRLHPEWPEAYVRGRVTWLRHRMTDEQVQTIYQEYEARKRRRRSPVKLED